MENKQYEIPDVWLFWTIPPKQIDLMIWLGAYFKFRLWAIHLAYLRAFEYLFESI
jgi:hypothetical protein